MDAARMPSPAMQAGRERPIDTAAPACDPFGERRVRRCESRRWLLGGHFHFASDSGALLRLVEAAYAGVPPQRLPDAPEFRIELDLLPARARPYAPEPPPLRMHTGAGVLCGVVDERNYVVFAPGERRALIVVSEDMLAHPYHVRCEMIEFAVYILAARGLRQVPLHAACLGRDGRGLLLLGPSGAGKSTLALCGLRRGLDLLAEDGVLVEPRRLALSGIPNYLHLRADALERTDAATRSWIAASPTIRRRSGVEKFELDLRAGRARLAQAPLRLAGVVFVSAEPAAPGAPLLEPLPPAQAAARLAADQPYAAGQPGWAPFVRQLPQIGVHRLRRGAGPEAALDALLPLLG